MSGITGYSKPMVKKIQLSTFTGTHFRGPKVHSCFAMTVVYRSSWDRPQIAGGAKMLSGPSRKGLPWPIIAIFNLLVPL